MTVSDSIAGGFAAEAEALWAAGERDEAILKFSDAVEHSATREEREMYLVGKGHALLGMKESAGARECFAEALMSTEGEAQIAFLNNLLQLAEADVQPTQDDIIRATGFEGDLAKVRAAKGSCEPEESHCQAHGLEGFSDEQVTLIEHIAKHGTSEAAMTDLSAALGVSTAYLTELWEKIAPEVKKTLETSPDMPCGHTCNTCPTKDTCKLHDTLGDLEDL